MHIMSYFHNALKCYDFLRQRYPWQLIQNIACGISRSMYYIFNTLVTPSKTECVGTFGLSQIESLFIIYTLQMVLENDWIDIHFKSTLSIGSTGKVGQWLSQYSDGIDERRAHTSWRASKCPDFNVGRRSAIVYIVSYYRSMYFNYL